MELALTSKGRERLDKGRDIEDQVDWDHGTLVYIDEYGLDDSNVQELIGTKGKEVVRRLFEAGFIEGER